MAKLLDENSLRAVKTYLDGANNDFVHKSGSEDISGEKTFKADIKMANNSGRKKITFDIGANDTPNYGAWIGAETYLLTLNAPGGLKTHNSIIPEKPSGSSTDIDLGTSTDKWNNLYLSESLTDGTNSVTIANIVDKTTTQTISGDKTFSGQTRFSAAGGIALNRSDATTTTLSNGAPGATQGFNISNSVHGYLSLVNHAWTPATDGAQSSGTMDLGQSTTRWKNLYLSGNLSDGTNSATIAQLIAGSTTANPTLVGTESNLTSIQINQTKYNVIQWDSTPTSGHGAGYGVTSEGIATAISNAISSVYRYKGSVASYANLPTTGLTTGDVYNVQDTGANYAWTGSAWDELGGDVSNYVTINGTQTISGAKTFSANNGIVISGNSQTAKLRNGSPAAESGFIIELGAGSGGQVQLFQKSWSPTVDGAQSSGTADLGKSTLRWKNLYLSGNISDGTTSVTMTQLGLLSQGVLTENEALAILQGTNS